MINNLCLVGGLTQDPEAKKDGTIATFTIASGFNDEETLYMPCVAFSNLAELVLKKLIKGDKIVVCGKLTQHTYQAKDGTKKSTISCIVNSIEFIKLNKVEHEEPVKEPVVKSKDEPTYEELVNELINNNPKKEVD